MGVILLRVRLIGVTLLLRLGVLLRGFLTTNGPGREIGTTTGGATNRVGHFVADDSLGADKLDPEEPSLPTEGGMVSLVEILTVWARVRNFPFSMDLAGSRHASNSKLDVRPAEVESRLSAQEMMIGFMRLTERLL